MEVVVEKWGGGGGGGGYEGLLQQGEKRPLQIRRCSYIFHIEDVSLLLLFETRILFVKFPGKKNRF